MLLLRIVVPVDINDKALYTVRDVANRLGVHPETVRRLIHDGRLDAVRAVASSASTQTRFRVSS